MRYFIELSYKGTAYHGWQIQQNAPSVQGQLERCLSLILKENIQVVGAGRTDTGVHASHYVAHFDTTQEIVDPMDTCYHVNSVLPYDIAVRKIYAVANDAHARFDAAMREYTYYIVTEKDPFARETAWQYYVALNVKEMNEAASYLLNYNDFTSFAKLNSGNKTNICHISHARWDSVDSSKLVFTIRSDRFLRNMIRAIVGTLVDVGKGKITPGEFRRIIEARDLSLASGSAPAQGLFLSDVRYPEKVYL